MKSFYLKSHSSILIFRIYISQDTALLLKNILLFSPLTYLAMQYNKIDINNKWHGTGIIHINLI